MSKKPNNQAIITSTRVKFIAYGIKYEARKDHTRFEEIVENLRNGKTRAAVTAYRNGHKETVKRGFTPDSTGLTYKGTKLPSVFAEVYSTLLADGGRERLDAIQLFFDNMLSNPSGEVSVDALARFLSRRKMVITDRGTFLAYKRLNYRFYDCYTNSFNNTPGIGFIEMDRGGVDPVQQNTCSTGFHQCSYEYLKSYSGETIIVTEINPLDIVAVPPDYAFTKMRVCRYFPVCTLNEFKDLILLQAQDVLGTLPFFHTPQLAKLESVNERYDRKNLSPESRAMYHLG